MAPVSKVVPFGLENNLLNTFFWVIFQGNIDPKLADNN